jgi:hypothetical protein
MGEIRVIVSDETHKRLKQKAIEENTTIKELVPRIIEEYLKPKTDKHRGKEVH